jgi:hypothetical protein
MFRCEHDLDHMKLLDYDTCSICRGIPDSTLDDTIGGGRVIAWFTPSVEASVKATPQYRHWFTTHRNGEPTRRSVEAWTVDDSALPATHEPAYRKSWRKPLPTSGYEVVELVADDPQEIRVREAVRDFGLLTRHRDLKYATGIGLDYDAFVWGIVAPEADHLAVEGAGLPIGKLSTRATRPHDRNLESVRAWRASRGVA